jgi:hypothetical protein
MKKIILIVLIFWWGGLSAQTIDTSFQIYLLVGQSNMAGRGVVDSISKETNIQIVMLDKNGNWIPATDPVHFDKPAAVGVGPAIGFAKEMIKGNSKIKIGLVPCAWGGSSIKVWEPDSAYLTGHPYDDAIARTKIAMQSGVLKGILWHQGESDNSPQGVEYYMDKLKILITRFRTTFNNNNLPFVVGEIGYFGKSTRINKVLNDVPNQIIHTAIVSAEGLTDKGDQTHFDAASARELGRRYAIAMKKLLKL